jgi:tetratricopeptide (TPR) repeat protein
MVMGSGRSGFLVVSRLMAVASCLVVSLAGLPVLAQADFTCDTDVNRTTVPQGESVILTVSAQGEIGWSADFALPDIQGVRLQSGGTNQSMSMVNGKTRTSVSRTWFLTVESDGDVIIPPVTITVGGRECKTDPVRLRVTAPKKDKQIPPATTGNRVAPPTLPQPGADGSLSGQPGDDIFLTLETDQDEVFVGQQVILTFRYWRRIQPWNNPSYVAPRTEGFWREGLGAEKNYRRVVQGRAYNVTEIRYALFPTRSGELVIEPAELSFPEGVFDRFFNSRRSRRGPNVLKTRAVPVRVLDLPVPRPDGFSGLVASRVSLQSTADRDTVPRGEAVGLKVTLVADGFLKGFSGLKLQAPADARMHDASESFESRPTHERMSGMITVEKVLVPDQDGVMSIPPVDLVWFDSSRQEYRTSSTEARRVVVTPSDLPLAGDDASGFLRSEINRLSGDLAFIHQAPAKLRLRPGPWLGSFSWWVLFLLPVALLVALKFYFEKLSADRRDPSGRRSRLAISQARANLGQAAAADDVPEFMAGVARAVSCYVADCTNRPLAAIGAAEVQTYAAGLGLAEDGDRLAEIMGACDRARYGGSADQQGAELAGEVATVLKRLEEHRLRNTVRAKGSGRGSAPGLGVLLALAVWAMSVSPAGAADDPDRPGVDPVRLVAEGNQAYTEGDVDRAIADYRKAVELGANDAVLHFNLGNAYARRGELGRAVVSYLRARRLDPLDGDIRTNLAWVRRHIKDLELTEGQYPLFIAQAAAVIAALTLDQWGLVLVLLIWVTAGLVGWAWYREDFGTRLRRALLACAAGLLVVAAVTIGRWYHEQVRDQAVVVVEVAAVRSGPADNFPVLFEVHDGLTVNIEGERQDWVRIGLGGEWVGWLPAGSVEAVRQERPTPSP